MLIVAVLIGAAVAAAHMVPFPFLMEAFRPSRSLWHVKGAPGTPPTLYFTFDDGPNAQWTPPLLDALREHQVRATFFLIDEHITEATSPIVRRMAAEGHAIGLHSGTRRLMVASPDASAEHLNRAARSHSTDHRASSRAGCSGPMPAGAARRCTEGLAKVGYRLAGWSWGMWDWDWWRSPRAERVGNRIVQKASAGDIIVIHDGHHQNPAADRRHAGETMARIAPPLRSRGFTFGTLCEAAPALSFRSECHSRSEQNLEPDLHLTRVTRACRLAEASRWRRAGDGRRHRGVGVVEDDVARRPYMLSSPASRKFVLLKMLKMSQRNCNLCAAPSGKFL